MLLIILEMAQKSVTLKLSLLSPLNERVNLMLAAAGSQPPAAGLLVTYFLPLIERLT